MKTFIAKITSKQSASELLKTDLLTNKINLNQIVKINIISSSNDLKTYNEEKSQIKQTLNDVFSNTPPAYSITRSTSTDNIDNTYTFFYINDLKDIKTTHKIYLGHSYTTISHQDEKLVYTGQIETIEDLEYTNKIQRTFDFAEHILDTEELGFDSVIQQRSYIEQMNSLLKFQNQERTRLDVFEELCSYYLQPYQNTETYSSASILSTQSNAYQLELIAHNNTNTYRSEQISDSHTKATVSYFEMGANSHISITNCLINTDTALKGSSLSEQSKYIMCIIEDFIKKTNASQSLKYKLEFIMIYLRPDNDNAWVEAYFEEKTGIRPQIITPIEMQKNHQLIQVEALINLQ